MKQDFSSKNTVASYQSSMSPTTQHVRRIVLLSHHASLASGPASDDQMIFLVGLLSCLTHGVHAGQNCGAEYVINLIWKVPRSSSQQLIGCGSCFNIGIQA